MTDYVDLTRYIVEQMVGDPSQVEVTEIPRGRTTIIEVGVADADMGKLIGKGGRNIDAVRAVVRAAGLRGHQRVQVEVAEDDDDTDDTERTESDQE